MNVRRPVTVLLIGLTAILHYPEIGGAKVPAHLAILYTSDELGYLEPCG